LFAPGHATITSNQVSSSFSFDSIQADPPTFTLRGDTSGGPPESYTWRRNGEEIVANSSYNISIAVNGLSSNAHQNALYRSTLIVTGRFPGVYEYSVINRAMSERLLHNIIIEGLFIKTPSWHEL